MSQPNQRNPAEKNKNPGNDFQQALDPLAGRLTPQQVEDIHKNADTDLRKQALHHTIGPSATQAAPGNILENLFADFTFTGSRTNNQDLILQQILNAFEAFGANDSTTA